MSLAERIWTMGRYDEAVNVNIATQTFKILRRGLIKGFGSSQKQSDRLLKEALTKNVAVFSVFKQHKAQREVASLLGKVKTKAEFIEEAMKINTKWNRHWLDAEYDTAYSQAQSAVQWNKIQREKLDYPYLKYVTKADERVRHSHAALHGVVQKVDSPFWNTHMPSNGYRCRCTVVQLKDATETENIPNEEFYHIDEGFNINSGKVGEIFSNNHQYFQDLDDKTVQYLKEYAENMTNGKRGRR
jgi:SPP1 gp7 family putative phage head morphogenesis protein